MTKRKAIDQSLSDLLASRRSAAPALIDGGAVLSYADLEEKSRRVATGLSGLGVGPGDRVGVWLPNTPAWLILFFACARLGVIVVAVNTRFRSAEVEDIVGRSGCKVLALWPNFKGIDFPAILGNVDPDSLDALETVVVYGAARSMDDVLPGRRSVAYGDLEAAKPMADAPGGRDSPCVIFTTSGTTSAPKFVLHLQSSLLDHAVRVAPVFGYTEPGAKTLQAIPLCGTFGLAQALATLVAGKPVILMSAFDAEAAVRLIHDHEITQFNGSDEMMDLVLAATDRAKPFPSLRFFGCARFNAGLDDIGRRAADRGIDARGLYGMSEVQALLAVQPPCPDPDDQVRPGGVPVSDDVNVRARDPETGKILPDGEDGELEFRGPSQMAEYFGDPEATRKAMTADGFLRSGDLGHTRPDGGFNFIARMGDVLRLGGFLVSPPEIESHLVKHPAVSGAQVVGAQIDGRPRAVAFVTVAPGEDFDEAVLRGHCRDGLAGFKVPYRIFELDAFPTAKSANGTKIQRAKLREMADQRVRERDSSHPA